MPTPVSSARQCLTDDAARALDDAVAVARRRSHSQTTSLHAVSALLLLPTSTLRDACARARSSAYSPRLQFRALELCVSVSLDRLPSSKSKTSDDEPPVSNSLMAAIKRSQANQRRHPENFQLYQMHQQLHNSQSSISCVKVELKHFILSILDDPIVSRVFGDAGLRSTDIKIAVSHPPPVSGFHKSMRFPPLFLCNLPDSNRFNFPFAVDQGEEDFKRIGRVLTKKTAKNPLLIGVSAGNVLAGFTDSLKMGKSGFLPSELAGLNVIDINKEIHELIVGNLSEETMELKLKEVRENVESCKNCGVVVNFGELKVFVNGGSSDLVGYIVSQLSNLVKACDGKLWLIGAAESCDAYTKILTKFPALETEWDLNLLPITSSKLNTNLKSGLMGSFVPFGGFFPAATELENSSINADQSITRCDLCNDKYEHEVSVVLKGGRMATVADQPSTGLASWLEDPESNTRKGINRIDIEAKDHGGVFNARRLVGLQRKWNDICHRLHQNPTPHQNASRIITKVPVHHHFPSDAHKADNCDTDSNQRIRFKPTTSVTLDLGLGAIYVLPDPDPRLQDHETRLQDFNMYGSAKVDEMTNKIAKAHETDFKKLFRALADKVGYEDDCVRTISQTISRCRTGNGRSRRGDIWFMFSGADRMGKKKICTALAEVVFGSRESLISINLNFENQIRHPSSIFNRRTINFSDPSFRGKTITDFIADELSKKPRSIILLEHIDKADFVTQERLSRAIRTGKLSDTRGREIRITDAIFITTISSIKESDDVLSYSEERIMNAKALQMRISMENVVEPGSSSVLLLPRQSTSANLIVFNKRKLIEIGDFEMMIPAVKKLKSCFDLNLPSEEAEDGETVSETKSWWEEFLEEVDENVVFKKFDFESHLETILKEISICFQKSIGSNVVLEIENNVIVQILASCWLSDRIDALKNWIANVLYRGFTEAKQKQRDDTECLVKLVAIEGLTVKDDDASCVCLPSTIIVE